jgi:hypothetical protein
MSKKGNSLGSDSLDMLLDTMCNTFGCIIFVAILMAVVSQEAGDAIASGNQAGVSEAKAAQQRAQLSVLEQDIARQEQLVKVLVEMQDDGAKDVVDHTAAIEREKERGKELEEIRAASEKKKAETLHDIESTKVEIDKTKVAIGELEKRLQEGRIVTRKFRVPRLRTPMSSADSVVNCVLQGGRFYVVRELPPGNGSDAEDVAVSTGKGPDGAEFYVVTPLAKAGQPIQHLDAPKGKLKQALELDPKRTVVEFTVYPDSFREFILLKQEFAQRHFEYAWKPLTADAPLVYRQGRIGMVQR